MMDGYEKDSRVTVYTHLIDLWSYKIYPAVLIFMANLITLNCREKLSFLCFHILPVTNEKLKRLKGQVLSLNSSMDRPCV